MRGFVALVRREVRDLRWHFRAALFLGAVTPAALHGLVMGGVSAGTLAAAGGRVIVPLMFALFTAATASDLVSREVATRKIDVLAALPVPPATVWKAKFGVLLLSSLAFLVWTIGAEWLAIELNRTTNGSLMFFAELADGVPSLLLGLALGMAALFFSTLVERGMSAALAAIVAIVAVAVGIEIAEMPAARGGFAAIAMRAVPVALAAAFAVASYRAFVRGPIHGPSKLRVAVHGFAALVVMVVPASAALAFGLSAGTYVAPNQYAGRPEASLSPNGKWVAVMNYSDGVSHTWLVGIEDGSCRLVLERPSWFAGGSAWLPGSMLSLRTSAFSVVTGPLQYRDVEIEPVSLGIAESSRVRSNELMSLRNRSPAPALADGRRIVCDGVVTLVAADGTPIRRLFPPTKGN